MEGLAHLGYSVVEVEAIAHLGYSVVEVEAIAHLGIELWRLREMTRLVCVARCALLAECGGVYVRLLIVHFWQYVTVLCGNVQ